MAVLTYRDVSKRFDGRVALWKVDVSVEAGEIFGFIGPDGAGKTTLIRMAMGIVDPDEGACLLLGSEDRRRARVHAGYVSQIFSLYTAMTVMENISLFGALYGAPKNEVLRAGESALRRTGLWPFRDRLAGNLSGGMKQKLALAIGLLHTPTILFLDEPTTGVDPVARMEFWSILYDLNKGGMTIVVSTPYMDEAELCTRKLFVSRGKVLDFGTSHELLSRYPHRVLQIGLRDRRAKEWLSTLPGVVDANLFGVQYHLVVDDVRSAETVLRREFSARGYGEPPVKEIPPTLEDLFVFLSAAGERR